MLKVAINPIYSLVVLKFYTAMIHITSICLQSYTEFLGSARIYIENVYRCGCAAPRTHLPDVHLLPVTIQFGVSNFKSSYTSDIRPRSHKI